ncbi:MAG: diguanylate cyclase, partial [Methylococcales bacterium]|nr:diguanylate cyclase [Methylococcales bacterium]
LNQQEPHVSYEAIPFVDGHLHELEITKTKLLDSSGNITGIIGISVDITDRNEAEKSLRLAATIYEYSAESMLITDARNTILAVNPAFTKMTGFSAEEAIGKTPSILSSGQQDPRFYKKMWDEINKTGTWDGELWNKHKNGHLFAERLSINTIYTKNGTISHRIGLFSDITEKKETDELIWRQANYDTLTKLPNRHMFYDRLDHEMLKSQRESLPMALLFIDLDHFKEINDTLGHDMGDILLTNVAHRITSCVREVDTVARLGGDEFTVILSELHELSSIERITGAILSSLSQPFSLNKHPNYISASIGITLYPHDGTTLTELLKNADQAMYRAKDQGRNCFSYFTPEMQESAQKHLQILTDLRSAITDKQFQLYYQPIVGLASKEIHKAEALIRWHHPTCGMISPDDFIPIAEESGLIISIGDWVFKEAAQQMKQWIDTHGKTIQVSINKSPIQFKSSNTLADWFDYLQDLGLSGEQVVIEITEGLLMGSSEHITDKLHQFRDANIQVSLDDFGTGYSSL